MKKFSFNNRFVTVGFTLLGLVLLGITLPRALIATAPPGATQVGADASDARWQAIADFHAAKAEADDIASERAMDARWQAIADFHAAKAEADAIASERAMGARWQAMADFYAAQTK